MASISTAQSIGRLATPTAERVWRRAHQTSRQTIRCAVHNRRMMREIGRGIDITAQAHNPHYFCQSPPTAARICARIFSAESCAARAPSSMSSPSPSLPHIAPPPAAPALTGNEDQPVAFKIGHISPSGGSGRAEPNPDLPACFLLSSLIAS